MRDWQGSWIWADGDLPERNAFARFRRAFEYSGGGGSLHITADSRYVLYVNGEYVGQGPVRGWTSHWRYDTYDLGPLLRPGRNVLAVLANHFGEGNFQYLHAPKGLLANLEFDGGSIATDGSWSAAPYPAFEASVPRISIQEAYEEQFDARMDDGWTAPDYDDSAWLPAVELRDADDGRHANLEPRGIPFLTMEPILPQRVLDRERVESVPYCVTIHARRYLAADDRSQNVLFCHAYLATQVWSPRDTPITILNPHGPLCAIAMKVNGLAPEGAGASLNAGWNSMVVSIRGGRHLQEYAFCIDGPDGLKFCSTGDEPGSAWAVVGPFDYSEADLTGMREFFDAVQVVADPLPGATLQEGDRFWESCDVASAVGKSYFQQIAPEFLPATNVYARAYTDKVVAGDVRIAGEDGLLSGSDWATIEPPSDGHDVRILLDFGQEILGYHRFELFAHAGTVMDFHNFEFIQPDGRYNFAEGMNNSFRYVCRDGLQTYQTYVRRGFRYSYLILRDMTGSVRLRRVEALFSSYPQSRKGSFASSDSKLDRIWQAGANTLRACADDTYVDCPTYEQTNWVGDARNEALIDWAINGDPRLWYRCLEQTGDSLERSSITESNVPSAWQNLLPAWSFLWMRSCREYLLYTGDVERGRKLLGYIARNIEGIRAHLNVQGLFEIRAWNMFDWAAMDTPAYGVVTHQNCLAVHGLRDVSEMARWLGEPALASKWNALADSLSESINLNLWSEETGAYTDCLRDGRHSPVFSQQTQTAACMSGVASGERGERCRTIMHSPPDGFVRAGSPFFEFFLLEAYQQEGKQKEFLDTIRKDWGFMIEAGATTFWEMWTNTDFGFSPGTRLTRSHCHGWSAAPTFFLGSYILGVRPASPGFGSVLVEPHPGDLTWCRGSMPTPHGNVRVQWENLPDRPFRLLVTAPPLCEVTARLPRGGSIELNGAVIDQ